MADDQITALRDFPSVEELLQDRELAGDIARVPRVIAADIIREVVALQKTQFKNGKQAVTREALYQAIRGGLFATGRKEIARVINATGIVVHTNLGRAPLSQSTFDAIKQTVVGYGNVEFDLADGTRGKRGEACERYLARLAGSEAGAVVNNCAAGLFLTLNTLANRKSVIISRGELVQIGGGFRIPDILKKSGARLTEVGSTNITTIEDYEAAIDDRTGMLLKVHKSNFVQAGFTEEVALKDLVSLGQKYSLPVFNDLGSGVFVDTTPILGYHEPTVQQSVAAGAAVTSFSGDKLLGGSQAGLLVGSAEVISKIKRNPLFRTMRVDKITFSIIEQLLAIYLNGTHTEDIALWRLLSVAEADLYKRGKQMLAELGNPAGLAVEASQGFVGGGALPEAAIPSVAITFNQAFSPNRMMTWFRQRPIPIVGRIERERFLLDLKVVEAADLAYLTDSIREALAAGERA